MIRPCADGDLDAMVAVINAAATAYAGVIPEDRYHQPYMHLDELRGEIGAGVRFWGLFEAPAPPGGAGGPAGGGEELAGVMGIQDVGDVTLIRHAYVRPDRQRGGVGTRLLEYLVRLAEEPPARPLLVGTWAAAWWAVAFYERHGFALVTPAEKDRLLRRYWSIPARQVETSVVLRQVR
jgi:GNAT superfamily N-acetyltransferase